MKKIILYICLFMQIQSRQAGGHNALSSAVAECSPARSAVGLPVCSFSGGGQECLQDLQTRPLLGHKGPLADARAARKCGGGGSTEGQLTFLSRSGVQVGKKKSNPVAKCPNHLLLNAVHGVIETLNVIFR
ncbi:hypothetical protein AMECASPLE_018037 [Ameca splendens]|uniref:Secreted protein n=1 Tax=Ameca splendens TaxID=208324 RepID=A0ABV0ZYC1_9TELE